MVSSCLYSRPITRRAAPAACTLRSTHRLGAQLALPFSVPRGRPTCRSSAGPRCSSATAAAPAWSAGPCTPGRAAQGTVVLFLMHACGMRHRSMHGARCTMHASASPPLPRRLCILAVGARVRHNRDAPPRRGRFRPGTPSQTCPGFLCIVPAHHLHLHRQTTPPHSFDSGTG